MHTDHPAHQTLDRLLAGTLGTFERLAVIAHLAHRCELCWRYLRGATLDRGRGGSRGGGARPDDGSLAVVASLQLSAAGQAAMRSEELEALSLWSLLEGTPPALRLRLVASDRRYQNRYLVRRLLDDAAERGWREPRRAADSCRLALSIVGQLLPAAVYPRGLVRDLEAQALGSLTEALRLSGQLAAAEETLRAAWDSLDAGSGEALESAGLLRVAANLCLSQGDLAAAAELLRKAAAIYRLSGDRHQEGRTLQKMALAVGYEDPQAGVAAAERALTLLDPGREPRLELAARHALIWFLNDSGQSWPAFDLLERSRPLYHQLGETQPRLLLPWLEARICRRHDLLAAAEKGLARVWHDFRDAGFHQDLTLVSLDLAETWLTAGKTRHALRLLKTFHAILRHWHMHTEGIAAWLLLLDAASREDPQAPHLTREMALYFRRAWRRSLPFPLPRPRPDHR